MDAPIVLLVLLESAIVLGEGVLWILFRRNMIALSFPHEADASSLRFFTFNRIRLIAALHTAALMAIVAFVLLALW